MQRTAQLTLPDGRELPYVIRFSARSKSLNLRISARAGLRVSAPRGLSQKQVRELVADKSGWIVAQLQRFDALRPLLGDAATVRPQALELPALGEAWRVEYLQTASATVAARTAGAGRILVCGAVHDDERCKAALRRWLVRRAKDAIAPRLAALAAETGLQFRAVQIKNQHSRWGSCSAQGVISLNCKLLFLSPAELRYVLLHELCHTREHNHTSRFWALLRSLEPGSDVLRGAMREAWQSIPLWAHAVRSGWAGI